MPSNFEEIVTEKKVVRKRELGLVFRHSQFVETVKRSILLGAHQNAVAGSSYAIHHLQRRRVLSQCGAIEWDLIFIFPRELTNFLLFLLRFFLRFFFCFCFLASCFSNSKIYYKEQKHIQSILQPVHSKPVHEQLQMPRQNLQCPATLPRCFERAQEPPSPWSHLAN
jgi:hypothetical protein